MDPINPSRITKSKYKTRIFNNSPLHVCLQTQNQKYPYFQLMTLTLLDFQDNKAMLQVLAFALREYESLLVALCRSVDNPEATRLAIQNITFLMRTHKQCRTSCAAHPYFKDWRQHSHNPLYSLQTVEGLLLVHPTDPTGDVFLPEVQQFIYYITEDYWPLPPIPRIQDRFRKIWVPRLAEGRPSGPQFHDPGERWFSDAESEREDEVDDEYFDYEYEEFLASVGTGDGEGSLELLDDEPDVVTSEDLEAFFTVAEEAGLRSQDRRRAGRRAALDAAAQESSNLLE